MQVQELVGIVPWTFIAQICNLFIQMYLIKRFLFKPINEMLEKRRAAADAEITDAEAAKKEANAIKEEYEQNMQEAKAKANEILESASGPTVVLALHTDPSVLAGVRVELDGKLFDGTIKGRLAELSRRISDTVV